MNGVTTMVGSLLAWALGHIHSDKMYSYQVRSLYTIYHAPVTNLRIQIIFLACGLLTVVFSIFVLYVRPVSFPSQLITDPLSSFFLPDSPIDAKFLSSHDKLIAIERLRANQMGIDSTTWKWEHVTEALLDLKTWFWFALILVISIPSGGVTTFGPLIVNSFGFDSFRTILLNIPFGAVQIFATMGGAWFATWMKRKDLALVLLCIPPIIGMVMLLCISHTPGHRGPLLVGYYLVSPPQPISLLPSFLPS